MRDLLGPGPEFRGLYRATDLSEDGHAQGGRGGDAVEGVAHDGREAQHGDDIAEGEDAVRRGHQDAACAFGNVVVKHHLQTGAPREGGGGGV